MRPRCAQGGKMARVVPVVLVSLLVVVGCGQPDSRVEQQEKKEGVEQGNIPISGVIGDNIETPAFDYRILDVFTTDHYYYLENPSVPFEQDAFSQAGKFVVVNY